MDKLMFGVLLVIFFMVTSKNFTLLKRTKFNKLYINLYRSMLDEKEDAYNQLCDYLSSETNKEYITKTLIIKLYYELCHGLDYEKTFNELNLKEIFTTKDLYDHRKTNINTDSFIWLMMVAGKLNDVNRLDLLDKLVSDLKSIKTMDERLEYKLMESILEMYKGNKEGIDFLLNVTEGNYPDLRYEKQMIGLYKRFAAAFLASKDIEVLDYKEELEGFTTTIIGKPFMKQLGIYDRFHKEETE